MPAMIFLFYSCDSFSWFFFLSFLTAISLGRRSCPFLKIVCVRGQSFKALNVAARRTVCKASPSLNQLYHGIASRQEIRPSGIVDKRSIVAPPGVTFMDVGSTFSWAQICANRGPLTVVNLTFLQTDG